jgi:ATP-dependent helicase HrpB
MVTRVEMASVQPVPLPIDPFVPEIAALVRERRACVVVAPPGAGKTTRVPPALAVDGPLILLQPRRVAARALARRIAAEQGLTLGEEVGWQVRFERRFSPRTRLLVATEGILTARLQEDPLLAGFLTVVLDEFHERSLHGDLALALARQAARARQDLRLIVMSATLDAEPVAAFLGGCPIVRVAARAYPVEIAYRAGVGVPEAVRDEAPRGGGHVLAFLPGAPEIRAAQAELTSFAASGGLALLPLHGSLTAEEQDAALAPADRRKLILATNLAETSLTVDGVDLVIDSGLQKVPRYDAGKALDRLETERISRDSADQRSGRAGRTGPGRALRLWDARDRLAEHREAEIHRVDLSGPVLEILAWGGDPLTFEWFEAPPEDALRAALLLLRRLGAVEGRRLTRIGERMRRLRIHPRLARVLEASGASWRAAAACAVLLERLPPRLTGETTRSDVLSLVDRLDVLPGSVRAAARELHALAVRALEERTPAPTPAAPSPVAGAARGEPGDDETLLRALLLGFPDRVARRRERGSPRLLLASGHGAVLARESGVREPEFLLALDVAAGARGPASEALVRIASGVEKDWLEADGRETTHAFDASRGAVVATERLLYGRLTLAERLVLPEPAAAAALLAEALVRKGLDEEDETLLRRARFAGLVLDRAQLLAEACAGRTTLAEVRLRAALPSGVLKSVEQLAPETLQVPSGRRVRLEYREDGTVVASVKLQELFGLADSPRIGPRAEAVLLELLAPNGRPVQTTRDLRGFWERTYPEVRKELRGRYPRHPWPEDPWTATPTARTRRRG